MHYDIVVFGGKDTTKTILEYICSNIKKVDLIVTVDSEVTKRNKISGFENLDDTARRFNIDIFKTEDYSFQDIKSVKFYKENTFDIGISMGWQRLIPEYVLDAFKFGIFGFHGSCAYLPFGRGRSPLNWSLLLGDRRFVLNLFKYDKEADSPNVFVNTMWEINEFDTIRTLQYKNLLVSKGQIKKLLNAYDEGVIPINTYTKDIVSWYKKRTPDDGRINFSWRTDQIYNMIRAVTRPFDGAFCFFGDIKLTIWEAVPFDAILDFSNYCVGEIIDQFDGNLIVRTLDGSILIKDYESKEDLTPGCILK